MSTQKKIQFLYQPNDIEHNNHILEKSENGKKRRYLKGIASGTQVDGHGEHITAQCVKSFHEQANRGDVLLYADRHGVAYSDDIGILTKSLINPIGDWEVEYRLYDTDDGVGQNTLETVDKVWKQMNGFPPYKKDFISWYRKQDFYNFEREKEILYFTFKIIKNGTSRI